MPEPSRHPPLAGYAPPAGQPAILHLDDRIIAVDKPAGLLSVPGKGDDLADCLETRLKRIHPEARLVHRLDMDTSGLMIFARMPSAQRHLNRQFERREVAKTYIARIAGSPEADHGIIDLPLRADWPNRPLQMVCDTHGRPSRTRWRVLSRNGATTRVELNPETGRTHQLRVHMARLGHPILGDRFYGDADSAPRLMLHAHSLTLRHPGSDRPLTLEASVPF